MSERETDRNALVPYAANYPAQVISAGRQLNIAAQLNQDLERGRLVALLKRISPEDTDTFLSYMLALGGDLINRFEDHWNWHGLSKNTVLPWSLELIEHYEDRWCWTELSKNATLPWSLGLIERFEDRWNWRGLSENEVLPWSLELIERFENRWDWKSLSENQTLPWSLDLIERFEDHWCWGNSYSAQGGLSENEGKRPANPS
ncbi:MAG: hypothetical protein ABIR13_07175 [Polaromonas sp.]